MKRPPATAKPARARRRPPFPIVGVGASAGGLEAFTRLLKELPVDTGFGFVLVQHLDPQHESALPQLLARATAMPVLAATHRLRVKANHVYIIPPNTGLDIAHGVLQLRPRVRHVAAVRSIDTFFEALARDQHERAIGVILSGTANDGTLGLEAIKAEGGITFAQDHSARYGSMPESAAAAGCVDLVLAPEDIARELARIARHPYVAGRAPGVSVAAADRNRSGGRDVRTHQAYQEILFLIRQHTGVDFSLYKPSTIQRRIERRTVLNRQDTLDQYAAFLRGNARELDALFSDTLISVTGFFRNPGAFAALKRRVLARLLRPASGDEPLRVWVAGCSLGQEAYSLAMLLTEAADRVPHARPFQIFATDLNEANLEKARHGRYAKSLLAEVSPQRRRRFFREEEGGYQVLKALRERVVFARHNLISDPPFSRMDLVSCRNLLIYLEPGMQQKALTAFHYALKPTGFLFLGASESIGPLTHLFAPMDKKQKIYSRKPAPARTGYLPAHQAGHSQFSAVFSPPGRPPPAREPGGAPGGPRGELDPLREADRVTVSQFAPPGVLVNADLQILQFRGATGDFLEPPPGRASFDLLKMARPGLLLPLRAALQQARAKDRTVRQVNVPVEFDGRTRRVNLEIIPLKNLKERCFLVLFCPVGDPPRPGSRAAPPGANGETAAPGTVPAGTTRRCAELEQELAETRDYLASIRVQWESATAELQATNEEWESANEELQSLNEELETSKEELESTNEELTTVNEEVVNRNAELNRLNSDLTNLQASAQLAIVLLDRNLNVRRFSPQAEELLHLGTRDLGRPLRRLGPWLDLPDLRTIVSQTIVSGRPGGLEVRDKDERWYSLRVHPYVTAEKKVDGVVLVLVDINDLKRTERLIREEHEHAEAIFQTVPTPLVLLDPSLRLLSANAAFYRAFKLSPRRAKGRSLFRLGARGWRAPALRRQLEAIIPHRRSFGDWEVTNTFERIGRRTLLLNARLLKSADGRPGEILLGIQDITERRRAADELHLAQQTLTRHAHELETAVAERTAELVASNRSLQASHAAVVRSREKNHALLLEAQAMQRKLRQLAHQTLGVQEQERKVVSRELHDQVVQTLVGISMELSTLAQSSTFDAPTLRKLIARAQRRLEESVNSIHEFARKLRPAVLDDLGLIPALRAYLRSLVAGRKIKVHLSASKLVESIGVDERTALYRVAQEALTNVIRHAHATRIHVRIRREGRYLRMEIGDNGRSFDSAGVLSARNLKHLGLIGMAERLEMVGGKLAVHSAPGAGTTIRADLPCPPRGTRK